ncbi:MAG: geranylgeranylglyceryl/heptaprenylglyceryl phosphate synthase [Thaumarchaeota archaeon]|nr:geranylgeranylglyceryl/heptaprenylglyceryl phosphate synthase [Nitrososphaerota archaeon]MCY3975880.1 geranylgeranylglyceryl/heptaprenylglyceryl phosphate synthase [Nitrososphaerota archaeon]
MNNNIQNKLLEELKYKKTIVFVLIDSENMDINLAVNCAKHSEFIGVSAILIGGSSVIDQLEMIKLVGELKKNTSIPIILFPGNITGVIPGADAILFTSLLNSENPYFISKAQALAAPTILKFNLEPLSTAYIIIGTGTTAEFIGSAKGIPFKKNKLAAAYALAAKFFGMKFVYLEAGSGANTTVCPEMVKEVKKIFNGVLIVGGGINDYITAKKLSDAGADILVIGTLLEKKNNFDELKKIVNVINGKKF